MRTKGNVIFVIIMCLLITISITIQPVEVSGISMNPTLKDKQYLIIKKAMIVGAYKRYDVIVFKTNNDSYVYCIKRIIGMPGETVQIVNGDIYINGTVLDGIDGLSCPDKAGFAAEPIVLGQEEYFVLGDNRAHSLDSRFIEIGNVNQDDIVGVAFQ